MLPDIRAFHGTVLFRISLGPYFEILRFRRDGHASAILHARIHGETRGNSGSERDRGSSASRSRKDQKDEKAAEDIEEEAERDKEREREREARIRAPEEANNKKNEGEPASISVKCRGRVSLFLVDLPVISHDPR